MDVHIRRLRKAKKEASKDGKPETVKTHLRNMIIGDPSMSVLELWTAEFQENCALLIKPESEAIFDGICKREKALYSVMGRITGDGQVVVRDSRDGSVPVDLPLDMSWAACRRRSSTRSGRRTRRASSRSPRT